MKKMKKMKIKMKIFLIGEVSVIAEYDPDRIAEDVMLINPFRVVLGPQGVMLMPWVMGGVGRVLSVSKHKIITEDLPNEVVKNYYDEFIAEMNKMAEKGQGQYEYEDPKESTRH